MRIGVVFPQTEIGADPGAVRAYAQHADGLGYTHLLAYDHVLGADPEVHPGWSGPYDLHTTFHEPFVLFGYLAALTSAAGSGWASAWAGTRSSTRRWARTSAAAAPG